MIKNCTNVILKQMKYFILFLFLESSHWIILIINLWFKTFKTIHCRGVFNNPISQLIFGKLIQFKEI